MFSLRKKKNYLRVNLKSHLIQRLEHHHVMASIFSRPGSVVQSAGHLTPKSEVLGSIPGLATYFHFSFR